MSLLQMPKLTTTIIGENPSFSEVSTIRTDAMQIYFASSAFDERRTRIVERKLHSTIPELVRIDNIEELPRHISANPQGEIYVLLLIPTDDTGYLETLVDIASQYRDRVFFILISDEISATNYKRLVRTGGADWVSASGVPQEILDIISKRKVGTGPKSAPPDEPIIVPFVPSAGGVGNTTLAVEAGVHLKRNKATKERRVCLVDLDFQTSHVCDYLDIEPRLQIEEISRNPERLDKQLFELFISRHSSGLDIFGAPRSKFAVCDLNVSALDGLFKMISKRYDLVLIDLPVTWFAWTFQIISGSDGVIVTGVNTIPCLRQIAETLSAVRDARHTDSQIAVAVNRCERGVLGRVARRRHAETVLQHEKVFYIGNDPVAVESINTGTPLAMSSPSRKTSKDIAAIAQHCAALKSIRVASAVGDQSSVSAR
jgi:pilus assembly protein CpaE